MKKLTKEEKKGILMIKFLQQLAKVEETDESALAGWRKLSKEEKEQTIRAYNKYKLGIY